VADLGAGGVEIRDAHPQVVRGDLEGAARARGGLLEDEDDVLPGEARVARAGFLLPFQVARQIEEPANLLRGEVGQLQQASILQAARHRSLVAAS